MMNVVVGSSECSSGCESGWTLYLDHSTSNYSTSYKKTSFGKKEHIQKIASFEYVRDDNDDDDYDEEEDLSMVSDASSGPPHFDHDLDEDEDEDEDNMCYSTYNSRNGGRLRRQSVKFNVQTQCCSSKAEDFALDDTASSAVFTSKRNDGYVNVENHGSSYEGLIDYSSQGFSDNHVQGRSSNFQECYSYVHSTYSAKRLHEHNQLS